ncbi:MAG: branched-chain amino acid ABC transporter ATP-binding protein [Candidatus Angelobacter sp. Gp1-AA117]|nr:MAG: branched-chain amino acid ABC transporter ATP-binding protein [Candidatus Angelobacter sp. Gp1-AA117]
MPEVPEKLLLVENLEVRYGATQVLWGISFSVVKHAVTCIIGSNGAGKTTTLNAIAGVLPVKGGSIRLDGKPITALPSRERVKRHIALVPEGRQLWAGMSVEDNLLMGCYLPALRSRAHLNLSRVYDLFPRLKERRRQLAGTLSGGEQQMCAIGRGLMSEPQLLMLDEPSLGLAPILVEEIFGLIRDIARQGMTILLVGQNIHYTLQVSTYGYVMEVGKIALGGPSEMLLNHEHVRRAYLGIA